MIAKEIRRDQLWKVIHTYLLLRPAHLVRLYYKCKNDTYESLPLFFLQNDHRLPRLICDERAIRKAKSLPEPFRRDFLERAEKDPLVSLGLACSKYFGPLCRPDRANHTYNPFNELHLKLEEIQPIFPDIDTQYFYGKHIRFDQLATMYFGSTPGNTEPIVVEDPQETLYQPVNLMPLNQILYGPPGTGKTYYAVSYAVAIVEGKIG